MNWRAPVVMPQCAPIGSSAQQVEAIMTGPASDIAFTPTVKAIQMERGSRAAYAKMEARGGFRTEISDDLVTFLADVDTAYLATSNASGQPYAQHRGGPKGFLRVVDSHTIGFADYTGNQQYITTGNLQENAKAFLFLMDYAHRSRIKVWGRARVVDSDPGLIARLMPEGYRAKPLQAVLFEVEAWDSNCSQHIPQKLDAADVAEAVARLEARVDALDAENAKLRAKLSGKEIQS
jgi:predicted pyridoxine 5'-phosphate oxidase superfamily flavin-nucleotide-binding protein